MLASLRPTLDPLTLTPLRNAVIHSAWGRGKIDLPPGIAKKLRDTSVYVSGDIRESTSRKDLAKSMRVERVSDTAKKQKFKIKDERQESQQVDHTRKQEIERPDVEAKRGDKKAQQQVRQLEQQQKKETRAQEPTQKATQTKAERKAQQQPHGEQVGSPAKQQSKGASKQERKQSPPAGGQAPNQSEKAKAKSKGKGKP